MARQVTQAAAAAADKSLALLAQADMAIAASAAEPTRALADRLGALAQEAETRGLKSLSVECEVRRAETLLGLGDQNGALRAAERAIARAEGLGVKVSLARARFVKASVLRARKDPGARREYAAALRVFEEVKRDPGNENVFKRADLAAIYAEATREATGS